MHYPDKRHDRATQAHEAHEAIASALRGHDVAAVVVREADYNMRTRVTDGLKIRLRLAGACLSACLSAFEETHVSVKVKNGKEIGAACGGTKDDAFAEAENLGVDDKFIEAAAAALAAKSFL